MPFDVPLVVAVFDAEDSSVADAVVTFDEPFNVLCSLQRFGELLVADILLILLSNVGSSRLGKILT